MSRQATEGIAAALGAGVIYGVLTFMFGVLLGTIRIGVLAPALGPFWAVAVEAPAMALIAWLVCDRRLKRDAVPPTLAARAVMGVHFLIVLFLLEACLSQFVFGPGLAVMAAQWLTPPGALGLATQLTAAAFPTLRLMQSKARPGPRRDGEPEAVDWKEIDHA